MERDAFIETVRTTPDDLTARLVFADWLEERGEPLGAYIRAECAAESTSPGSPEWAIAVESLAAACERAGGTLGGWEYGPDLDRLRGKMDRLLNSAGRDAVFGAHGHRFTLNPTIPELDLLRFERRCGVTLPGEYRAFVLRVANGELGPSYGLGTLGLDNPPDKLLEVFPYTRDDAASMIAAAMEAFPRQDYERIASLAEETWDGCLALTHHGCGLHSLLVVRGELRGRMWMTGDFFIPDYIDGKPLGFFAWYERWLDEHLPTDANPAN